VVKVRLYLSPIYNLKVLFIYFFIIENKYFYTHFITERLYINKNWKIKWLNLLKSIVYLNGDGDEDGDEDGDGEGDGDGDGEGEGDGDGEGEGEVALSLPFAELLAVFPCKKRGRTQVPI